MSYLKKLIIQRFLDAGFSVTFTPSLSKERIFWLANGNHWACSVKVDEDEVTLFRYGAALRVSTSDPELLNKLVECAVTLTPIPTLGWQWRKLRWVVGSWVVLLRAWMLQKR